MKKHALNTVTIIRRTLGYGLLVTLVSLTSIMIYVLESRPDLDLWHEVDLDEEFDTHSKVTDFAGYLELEERLFDQLDKAVYQKTPPGDSSSVSRYRKGSRTSPEGRTPDWNRTFLLEQKSPQAGVLLLHGMSDSPYSLRHLGESLHSSGATVIGLRIPGHGTAPSGLVETSWKDMAAAVRIAAKHLKKEIGDKPLYLVGYSNGGALAVVYALESMADTSLPRPAGLALLSPQIGVSPAAAFAVWQGRIGHWLGLEKMAWNSISVEYDPYKYSSFAINAGDQSYRITVAIDQHLNHLKETDSLDDFPPVLAFQSAVDATVSGEALVTRLFDRLPDQGHELVIIDTNRVDIVKHLLVQDPEPQLDTLRARADKPFALSIITNAAGADERPTRQVHIEHQAAGQTAITTESTDLKWPRDVFSLSHIALPFPESDPIYGGGNKGETTTLGNITLRGERGALCIAPGEMLRQRWNPFYPWMEKRVHGFCKLPNGRDRPPGGP